MKRFLVCALLLTGCAERVLWPAPCEGRDSTASCTSTIPSRVGGGGTGTDAGTAGSDASVTGSVSGMLVGVTAIPWTDLSSRTRLVGWTVRGVNDASSSAITGSLGEFQLAGMVFVDGVATLQATNTNSDYFGTISYVRSTSGVELVAVRATDLQAACVAAGATIDPALAQVLIRLEGTVDQKQGVRATSSLVASATLYDDTSGVLTATRDTTGPAGTILLTNVNAGAGATAITLSLSHANAAPQLVSLTVARGNITYLRLIAPP